MKKKFKIKITGASGYLGNLIFQELTNIGYEVSGIDRSVLYGDIRILEEELEETDVLINLAGAPILQKWSEKNKAVIYNSRIKTTQNIVHAIQNLPESKRPKKFISASAIGIYKSGEHHNEESTDFDSGFLGKVVKDWEIEQKKLSQNITCITFRIGIVLGKKSKTIQNLILPFKWGLGATIGNGKQAFPFIHEKDIVAAFLWAIEDIQQSDIFNLTAPENINNRKFSKTLANKLNRPVVLIVPKFILKIFYGKAAILITESPSVSSEKILRSGFKFRYPNIESALNEITSV